MLVQLILTGNTASAQVHCVVYGMHAVHTRFFRNNKSSLIVSRCNIALYLHCLEDVSLRRTEQKQCFKELTA